MYLVSAFQANNLAKLLITSDIVHFIYHKPYLTGEFWSGV